MAFYQESWFWFLIIGILVIILAPQLSSFLVLIAIIIGFILVIAGIVTFINRRSTGKQENPVIQGNQEKQVGSQGGQRSPSRSSQVGSY